LLIVPPKLLRPVMQARPDPTASTLRRSNVRSAGLQPADHPRQAHEVGVPSKAMREEQDDDDNQEYPDEPVAPMAVAVARSTKAPAEAAQQEDHEYDDE
jgi:hypothetical protein